MTLAVKLLSSFIEKYGIIETTSDEAQNSDSIKIRKQARASSLTTSVDSNAICLLAQDSPTQPRSLPLKYPKIKNNESAHFARKPVSSPHSRRLASYVCVY